MECEEIKTMLEEIERIARCPICLETVKGSVAQCDNGHVCCGKCRKQLKECSICRGPFLNSANRVVEELLNVLPKPCPNYDKGCGLFTFKDSHVQFCKYRPISCKLGVDQFCIWTGVVKDWRKHALAKHDGASYIFNSQTTLTIFDFPGNWRSKGFYHKIGGKDFLFYTWKKGNEFCHTVRHLFSKKPQKEYFFKVTYKKGRADLYQGVVKSAPLKENDSMEDNPAIFLMADLKKLVQNHNLEVWVEALEVDLSKKH